MGRNEELVEKAQSGHAWALEDLWENNRALVAYIAKRYQVSSGRLYENDDLMQAGYLGLHVAAMTYSETRGASFSTYSVFHIRRAMREIVGLRGRRDVIFDSLPLDAPVAADDDHTLLDKIPAPEEESTLERDELARIMREAVSKMKNDRARETVQAVYWEGMTLSEFARIKGVSKNTVNEWMQRAYSILRGDWRVVSLALVEGYDTEYNRYKGLSMFSSSRSSSVENVVIAQEDRELRQKALYAHLGRLAASCFVGAPPDKEQEDLDHGSQ